MQNNVLQRLAQGARVTVIRLRSLGDCVLTTPALALLNAYRPDLKLSVVVEDRFAPIFEGNPGIDSLLPDSTVAVARSHPDLVVNLHGGSTSSKLMFAARARFRAGFEHFRYRALYNIRIPRAQTILRVERKVHTAEHLASAMFYLGVPEQEIPRARLFADERPAAAPYVVIHPKASAPGKTWPVQNFRAAAEYLRRELSLEPIFIAGPGESLDEFQGYRCLNGVSLSEIKSLLASASAFLGNDSGPAHMAAAFGLPVVVLFGSSDPVIWAPWKTESQVLIPDLLPRPSSIASIPVSAVQAALSQLPLEQPR